MLEKHFETRVSSEIPKEELWNFFSQTENIPRWNPNFVKYNCSCSHERHHTNVFLHFDLDRNAVGNFRIEEIERDEGSRIKFSIENVLYLKKDYNNFEIIVDDHLMTFVRYLDLEVFDEHKRPYWYKHFKDHHDSIIESLTRLRIKDGVISKE